MKDGDIFSSPWSDEQVEYLEKLQGNDMFHGYTCPGIFDSCSNHRKLVPTNNGWVCWCGNYIQDWVDNESLITGERLWQNKVERL